MIVIREADAGDVPALSDLYRQLVSPVAPDVVVDVRPDRIEEIRADPHNFLFVLVAGEVTCGTAFLTLCLDPMHHRQPYALLENVVIAHDQRKKGYGALLMGYIEKFCIRHDCSKIMLLSNDQRHEAHQFFKAQGFSSDAKKGFVKYRSQLRGAK